MAKQQKFPIVLKAGATAIRIYYSPHRLKARDESDQNNNGKQYDSYVVVFYRGGQRIRRRFSSLEEAKVEAGKVQERVLNEDLAALQLTGKDLLTYGTAMAISNALGIPLDVMAKKFAIIIEKSRGRDPIEVAEFFERHGGHIKEFKTVPEVVEELFTALRADNLSKYHIDSMERRLKAFSTAFPGQIIQVNTKDIADWLRVLQGKTKSGKAVPIVAKTKNHYRNAIVQLFKFARDHDYLPRGLPTSVEGVKAFNTVPSSNEILTVEEVQKLLDSAGEHLIPPLAIKAFSGVRTEEMLRMKWEHINWETKHIRLPAEVTKTSLKRLIPIAENLQQWLAPFRNEEGRICSRWERPQALFQAFDRHGKRQGIDVGANKFRNSYITYRVALTHDVHRVALECGNSPQMIQREYLELVTEDEGKKWFNVFPKAKIKLRERRKRTRVRVPASTQLPNGGKPRVMTVNIPIEKEAADRAAAAQADME